MLKSLEEREQEAAWQSLEKLPVKPRSVYFFLGAMTFLLVRLRLDRIFDYMGYLLGRRFGRALLLSIKIDEAINTNHYEKASKQATSLLPIIEPFQSKHRLYRQMKHDANVAIGLFHLNQGHREEAGEFLVRAGQSLQDQPIGLPKLHRLRPYLEAGLIQPALDYLDLIAPLWANSPFAKSNHFDFERSNLLKKWKRTIAKGQIPDDRYWQTTKEKLDAKRKK